MAYKITKTELKLEAARKRLEELEDRRVNNRVAQLAGRGFGKTMTAMAYISEPIHVAAEIAELERKLAKILENRELRKERAKERRAYKKQRESLQQWLTKKTQ